MVRKTDPFTRALAAIGALLAWFPIAATVATSVLGSISAGVFRFDTLDSLPRAQLVPMPEGRVRAVETTSHSPQQMIYSRHEDLSRYVQRAASAR